jgi:hypothetical protein
VKIDEKFEVQKCGEKRRQKPDMKLETGTAQIQRYHRTNLRGEQTYTGSMAGGIHGKHNQQQPIAAGGAVR